MADPGAPAGGSAPDGGPPTGPGAAGPAATGNEATDSRRSRARRRRRVRRRALATGLGIAIVAATVGVVLAASNGEDGGSRSSSVRPTATTAPTTSSSTPSTSGTATTTAPPTATPVPRSSNPVVALVQQYDGTYDGRFQNRTFNSDGTARLTLRVDPATSRMTVEVAFDGDLFGSGASQPRAISSGIDLGDPTRAVTTDTASFGPVTGKLDAVTTVVLDAPDVPGGDAKSFALRGALVARVRRHVPRRARERPHRRRHRGRAVRPDGSAPECGHHGLLAPGLTRAIPSVTRSVDPPRKVRSPTRKRHP